MEHPISVTIAAYNASEVVIPTLDSVRAQTYKNYEVVVVDDGSPKPMREAIEAYAARYPDFPLRYVWQENTGPAGARKKCVEEAKHEFVALLDHDDLWYPTKLERVNDYMNRVEADVYYHDENEKTDEGSISPIHYRDLDEKDPVEDLVIKGNTLSTSATIVNREFFIKTDPYGDHKRYGEDYECWVRLAAAGARFCHIPEILGEYVRLSTSLTVKSVDYMQKSNEEIVNFYDYLDKNKYTAEQIAALKDERRAFNEYLLGRFYHANGEYRMAREYYAKSKKMGNHAIKCLVADLCAIIHKKI